MQAIGTLPATLLLNSVKTNQAKTAFKKPLDSVCFGHKQPAEKPTIDQWNQHWDELMAAIGKKYNGTTGIKRGKFLFNDEMIGLNGKWSDKHLTKKAVELAEKNRSVKTWWQIEKDKISLQYSYTKPTNEGGLFTLFFGKPVTTELKEIKSNNPLFIPTAVALLSGDFMEDSAIKKGLHQANNNEIEEALKAILKLDPNSAYKSASSVKVRVYGL